MPLAHISYHKAVCDAPGCNTERITNALSLSDFRADLRKDGWLIGRVNALCPQCAAKPTVRKRFNTKQEEFYVILPVAELRNVLAAQWGEVTIHLRCDADPCENKSMLVARYRNGTVLHVREGWIPATKTVTQYEYGEKVNEDTYKGVIFKADDAEYFPDCPEGLDPEFYLVNVSKDGTWRSPATMSRKNVRLHLRVTGTTFCKIHHGKRYYSESAESASKFNWVDEPWYEEITVIYEPSEIKEEMK